MKFLSLPTMGASWRNALVYSIDLETEGPATAHIEIINVDEGRTIASFNIYGVTTTEFDISPYVREAMQDAMLVSGEGLSRSPFGCNIRVMVNGVSSATRLFYQATINMTEMSVLTQLPENLTIAQGESIRLTILARQNISVDVQLLATRTRLVGYTLMARGFPVEFIFPLHSVDSGLKEVVVDVSIDGYHVATYVYKYVVRESTTMQMLWYNAKGGIESYIFPRVEALGCRALMETRGNQRVVVGREYTYALISAYESPIELRRIGAVIFADRVFCDMGESMQCVRLETRALEGEPRSLRLVIKSNTGLL